MRQLDSRFSFGFLKTEPSIILRTIQSTNCSCSRNVVILNGYIKDNTVSKQTHQTLEQVTTVVQNLSKIIDTFYSSKKRKLNTAQRQFFQTKPTYSSEFESDHNKIYTVSGKKRVWSISDITSSNTGRFLKFFHYYNLQEICNKVIVTYPTTP